MWYHNKTHWTVIREHGSSQRGVVGNEFNLKVLMVTPW